MGSQMGTGGVWVLAQLPGVTLHCLVPAFQKSDAI